jgi:hypothetical protein
MDIDVHYEGKVCKHDVIKIDIITKEKYPTTSKTLWRPIIGPQSVPMPMSAPIPKPLSAPIPLSERMHMRMPMPMPMPMPTPTPHNGKGPFFSDISSSQTRETTGLLHDELDEFEFIV